MSKRVMCIETGEIFGSASEASEKTGIDYLQLCANARGKRKSTDNGTHWQYIDPPVVKVLSDEAKVKRRGGNNGHAKPVVCIESGKYYPALSILADELNLDRPRISLLMKRGGIIKGLHYEFIKKE